MKYSDMIEPILPVHQQAAGYDDRLTELPPDEEIDPEFSKPHAPEPVDPDFGVNWPDPDQLPTPEVMPMRPRFDRHSKFNADTKASWLKFIERNPHSFDAILYRALPIKDEQLPDGYELPEFSNVDINQTEPVYQDPELVAVLDSPDDNEAFVSMDMGGENAVDADSVLVLQIAAESVPVGSVLEWLEETADGKGRRVWWYVHRAFNLGTTSAGTLYYCIPCRTFEGVIANA